MRRGGPVRTIIVALGFALVPLASAAQVPPPTAVREVTDVVHGTTIVDPYRWLEDQDSPETRTWIDRQNQYARAVLDPLPGRAELRGRLSDFVKIAETGWPIVRGDHYLRASHG
jgi:prolyl oligopeptidase